MSYGTVLDYYSIPVIKNDLPRARTRADTRFFCYFRKTVSISHNISVVKYFKQVAQRATIANLSPMCQGQISFKKIQHTYKWAMEIRGSKSNSSQLLCLSWVPATLMMIRSKMNELAGRHHFPPLSLWDFLDLKAANSVISDPIWSKFKLIRDFMHVLVTCKYKRIGSKATDKRGRHHLPHCKSMVAFCCHGNKSFDPICPKTLCSFPPPQ